MELQLQDFVEAGLAQSPPELRRAGEAVVRAAKSGDWKSLDLDAQAAAVVLCKPAQTAEWLEQLVTSDPLRGLLVAIRSASLHLRFAMVNGTLVRILERPERKPAAQLPAPHVWLLLRRAFDASPLLRAQALASLPPLSDLRLRAAISFVFPDEDELWSETDTRAALDIEDPWEALYFLFATLRKLRVVATSPTWPPPVKLLTSLPDDELEEALSLMQDEKLALHRRQRASVREAEKDVTPLLANVTSPDALSTLSQLLPTPALVAMAEGFDDVSEHEERILQRSFIESWKRELTWDGPPRDAPWLSPWLKGTRRKETTTPPPGPPLEPGQWEQSWKARPPPPELLLAWNALERRSDVRPWEVSFVLDLGPTILPRLRAWARREPALLVATQEIDDGGLDEALLLAWGSRRVQLSLAAREFARRFPARAQQAALRLCFSTLPRERAAGVVVLRALQRDATRALDALNPEQRAWVDQLLSARPPLPARKPALPEFVRLPALPPVVTADGSHALSEDAVAELVAVFKAAPIDDSAVLQQVTAGFSTQSLEALAGVLFRQWLAAGAPPREKWALNALAHFPSDDWATVVGALCQQWAQGGFPARAQEAVEALGRMGTRLALREVHRLATRIRTTALRARAKLAFHEAASRLGISAEELEDRLVPDVGELDGATVSLDGALRPVLKKDGKVVPPTPDVKLAARALKPALARLERAMCEGPGFGAVHFTETWGMHPLLHALAARVLWGVFKRGQRVGLFVPSEPPQGDQVPLDEDTMVRPVHPLELSEAERQRARPWLPDKQPFEQLDRACYPASELKGRLQVLVHRTVTSGSLLSLERQGWERGAIADGGTWMDVVRRGDGWHVAVHFDPGIWAGNPTAMGEQQVTGCELEAPTGLSPRIASEIQRDLVKCFSSFLS